VSTLFDLIRNPPLEFVDDDGTVCDRFRVSRRERLELMRPHWTYTILARELACGCTQRWWGTITAGLAWTVLAACTAAFLYGFMKAAWRDWKRRR
jgi:hypothetical protein